MKKNKINYIILKQELKEWIKSFFITFIVILITVNFLIQPFQVKGKSMLKNYYNNEIIVIKKIYNKYENGKVVVLKAPYSKNKEYYIKRIIWIPWNIIKVENWKVYKKNNELDKEFIELKEPYLNKPNIWNTFVKWKINSKTIYKVPEWKYLLFWDNRLNSTDSRSCFSNQCDIDHSPYLNVENLQWEVFLDLWYFNIKKFKFINNEENLDTTPKFFNINKK